MKVAVVGTRNPTSEQLDLCGRIVQVLMLIHPSVIISTGMAPGIDQKAVSEAFPNRLHLYLPWKSFEAQKIPVYAKVTVYDPKIHREWTDSVFKLHPAPDKLKSSYICLHARNYGILADQEWASACIAFPRVKGYGSDNLGGTGQAIRIADKLGIPKFVFPHIGPPSISSEAQRQEWTTRVIEAITGDRI